MWIKTSEWLPELSTDSIEPGVRKSSLVLINPSPALDCGSIELGHLVSTDNDEPMWETDRYTYDLRDVVFWCPIPKLPGE